MALNIGASGIIRPYVKYNAKSDKWFIRKQPSCCADCKHLSAQAAAIWKSPVPPSSSISLTSAPAGCAFRKARHRNV
jgi:hypothetical protein